MIKNKYLLRIILKLSKLGIIKLNDKNYLKVLYKYRLNRNLNVENPQTFNEKIQWLKLYDRKDIYTTMVDKYSVKQYVSNIIGEEYVIPTIGIYNNFDEINFDNLPKQFVMKSTHDSGGLIIVKDKEKLDINLARKKINDSLKRNYYKVGREWPYKNVKPRIIVEEYMEQKASNELIDYKIMCFNGEPKMLFTCTDRYNGSGLKVTFFDLNWNKLPFERHYPSSKENIIKPKNFEKMVEYSRKMSKNIPFVRIDWYEVNNKLYFGEYTFYPGNGLEEFKPEIWDYKLGRLIKLPIKKEK